MWVMLERGPELLRERRRPADQVHQIAVEIIEKHQTIAHVVSGFADKMNALSLQRSVSRVKIVDRNGEMPDAGDLVIRHRLRCGHRGVRRDDFDQRAVQRANEIIACIGEVDPEFEVIHIPLRELFRVRGTDGGVFKALEHKH